MERDSNPGGQFKFKIGQRVVWTPNVGGYPSRRVRIIKRTIEAALGKTYLVRYQDGRLGGYIPERDLAELEAANGNA